MTLKRAGGLLRDAYNHRMNRSIIPENKCLVGCWLHQTGGNSPWSLVVYCFLVFPDTIDWYHGNLHVYTFAMA